MKIKSLHDISHYGYIYVISKNIVYTSGTLTFDRGGQHKVKVVLPKSIVCNVIGDNGAVINIKSMSQVILPKDDKEHPVKYTMYFFPVVSTMGDSNKGLFRTDYTINVITDSEVYDKMDEAFPIK